MKAKTLQIVWHEKDPVFSIDFHPDGYIATGGGDRDIKLWEVCRDAEGNPQVRYASSLSAHTRSVNCVRFSHSGHCLASAADRGELIIWRPDPRAAATTQPAATSPAPGAPPVAAAYGTPLPPSQPRDKASSSTPGSAIPFSPGEAPAAAVGGDGGWAQAGAWRQSATLRGHLNDVTDVAWAHDDAVVMSGSVDSEVMLFDVEGRKTLARLQGHRHYVQGVAWDPLGAWMISQSADRTVRVHGLKPPPSGSKSTAAAAAREGMRASTALARDVLHTHTLSKVAVQPPATPPQPAAPAGEEPAAAAQPAAAATTAAAAAAAAEQPQKPLQAGLFHDESLNIFFRRPAWSPEGSLLAVPAGLYREHAGQTSQHATYLWARGHWGCPLMALPCPSKPSTVVRFCPRIFKLREQQQQQQGGDSAGAAGEQQQQRQQESAAAGAAGVENVLGLPYRLVLAVATLDSVLLYDLQTCEPFMLVGPLHYAPITDLAWSRDGSCLAVSSHDGYCSMVTFQPGELGEAASMTDPGVLPEGLQAALQKVQAAAAATAAKAVGAGAGAAAAAQMSPKVVSVTPRPAAGATAAGGGGGDRTLAQAGGQQQAPKPRRVQPEAVPAAATDMGVIESAAGGSSRPPAASDGGAAAGQPRRVTPQPVPAGQVFGAPAAFGAAPALGAASPVVPAAAAPGAAAAAGTPAGGAAAAAPAGAKSTPGPSPRQQQERAAKPAAAPAGAGKVTAAPAAGAGAGRVGLAAVQAALAAAKKKAAAKRAAEEGAQGISAAPAGDDDVVIVGEVAAAGEAGGVSKKPKTQ